MPAPSIATEVYDVYNEKQQGSSFKRFWEKTKNNPSGPIGFAGMTGMLAYGAYSYKYRGNMSTSVYLMHLRVKAQSMVVGALTIGVAYALLKDFFKKENLEKK